MSSSENEQSQYPTKSQVKNGKTYDTTFMPHKYHQKNDNPAAETALWTGSHPQTPTKAMKLKICTEINKTAGTLPELIEECKTGNMLWERQMSKMSKRSLERYQTYFKSNSDKYIGLKTWCKDHAKTDADATQRFFYGLNEEHYGIWPIFEEYNVIYRKLVAKAHQNRSVSWMQQNMRFILKNKTLMKLLKPLMKNQEWELLKLAKISEKYVRDVMVGLFVCLFLTLFVYLLHSILCIRNDTILNSTVLSVNER